MLFHYTPPLHCTLDLFHYTPDFMHGLQVCHHLNCVAGVAIGHESILGELASQVVSLKKRFPEMVSAAIPTPCCIHCTTADGLHPCTCHTVQG